MEHLVLGKPVKDWPYRLPESWSEIRQEINSVVFFRKGDALQDGTYSEFEYDDFFAASDTLCDYGDVIWAAANGNWPSDISEAHLRMCGALQAMIVVRNATRQFSRCLGVNRNDAAEDLYHAVADPRIMVAGHPENHKRTTIRGATYLGRRMERPGVFEVGTYPDNGRWFSSEVDIPNLLEKTEEATFAYMKACHNAVVDHELFDTENWVKYS